MLVDGGCCFRLSARVVEGLDSDGISGRQLRAPLVLLEQHEMLSVSRRERGFGVCERESKALLVDDEEYVALVHELIIPHANIINPTGNVGRHCHHIGADPGVSGPWRIEVVDRHATVEIASKAASRGSAPPRRIGEHHDERNRRSSMGRANTSSEGWRLVWNEQ